MALVAVVLAIVAPSPPVRDECHTPQCAVRVRDRHRRAIVRPLRAWLADVRWCESRDDYTTNTGNGFFGAYQFTLSSWRAVGGRGMPHRAKRLTQDYRAVRLLHLQGRGAWPVCG